VLVDLGKLAFRSIAARHDDDGFGLSVNGVPIFCRGACWSTPDVVSLRPDLADLERTLRLSQAANMNMLRVGGTMIYEDARFYELCDELGLLVWQDFMYASMDYPADDAGFLAEARVEAAEIVAARRRFACLAVYCGGSEVEQRAAMMGRPRGQWSSALFEQVLPDVCATHGSSAPYVRNSPSGGPLPFTVNAGIAHYYGVGAYLRPLEDARRAGVRFASESLGFSNVPEPATLEAFLAPDEVPPSPRWKARVPRENAAGWDFDDVRDFYLKLLYGIDPAVLGTPTSNDTSPCPVLRPAR
jgi:beta-mannosidase